MATRFAWWIILMTALACTPDKKDNSESSSNTTTQPLDDRVIILPQSDPDTLKGSLKAYAESDFGSTHVEINYYSPAVRGRTIWGGLVAYDNVWVTGAHRATSIEFNNDLQIADTIITKGKYAIFTIPGKEQWTIILNKNWNQHLADDYDPSQDVLRFSVEPGENEHQERLRYEIKEIGANQGMISISWEKLIIPIEFSILGN